MLRNGKAVGANQTAYKNSTGLYFTKMLAQCKEFPPYGKLFLEAFKKSLLSTYLKKYVWGQQ